MEHRGLLSQDLPGPKFDVLLSQLAPFDVKLKPPDLRGGTVERESLHAATIDSTDIVVLTAGAGYGKTTLMAQWARSRLPWAWLTLHREDNDPATLVAYLLRALQSAWACPIEEIGRISEPGGSELSILLPRLSRLVASIPGNGVLVLDEIGAIEDTRCLRILETVLESAPPGLHVLMSGRSLPSVGLERLRTRRRILKLDEDNLAFSYAESVALVECAKLRIQPRRLRRIHHAEGWPAGVYLMALSEATEAPTASPAGPVAAYVQEQVLTGLDTTTVDFLIRTSVLDLQDGPSCDALLGRNDSAATLARLSELHLLVIPVDGEKGSYRYHGLLSEVLRSEVPRRFPDELRDLHLRASEYYAVRGEREPAVRHSIAAGDRSRTAELVWDYVPFLQGIGQSTTVASWLRGLEEEDYDRSPVFALARSMASVQTGDGRHARLWLDLARRHPVDLPLPNGLPLGFLVRILETMICDEGVTGMVESAQAALAFDVGDSPYRCIPLLLGGCGMALLGDLQAATPLLDEAISIGVLYPTAAVNGLAHKAEFAILEGDWISARRFVQRGREHYEHFRLRHVPTLAVFPAVAAMVAAHEGDIGLASSYSARARTLLARMNELAPWTCVETMILLGQVELCLGHGSVAIQLAKESRAGLADLSDAVMLSASLRTLEQALENDGGVFDAVEALTTAEIRVLTFLPTHLTFGQIADELVVSVNTVKSQVKAIYRKLDVASRGEAVDRAKLLGLIDR